MSSVSLAAFSRPPPFPMRGLLLLDTDCGGTALLFRHLGHLLRAYRDMGADVLRCVWDWRPGLFFHVGYPGAVVFAPATVICITVVVLGGAILLH